MTMDKTSDWDLAPHDNPEFVAAWCKMEDEGYIYSESNVAKVHLGWLMARKYAIQATGVVELLEALSSVRMQAGFARLLHDKDDETDKSLASIIRTVNQALTQLAKGSE